MDTRRQDSFGLRELGLNLSTTPGDVASLRHTKESAAAILPLGVHTKRDTADIGRRQADKARKVTRYFPGQVPRWVKAEEPLAVIDEKPAAPKVPEVPPKVELPEDDSSDESSAEGDADAAPAPEDVSEVMARRARVREKLKQRQPEEHEELVEEPELQVPPLVEKAASSDSSESSEEEESSSSESEEDEDVPRPVFVPRSERGTIHEAEARRREEEARLEKEKVRKAERQRESRALAAEITIRDEAAKHLEAADKGDESDLEGAPSDHDDPDDPLEFEAWRLRELARAERDKDDRERAVKEAAETERRRNMTTEERAEEDRAIGKGQKKEKVKWKFLQKYHHKGAFFMDEDELATDDVRRRDTDGAVGEDKFDRSAMPRVMQVRDFGFAGRTKYTHLVDQDTTFIDRDNEFNGWIKRKDGLRAKYNERMAGTGDLDRPFQRRRKKDK